MSEIALSTMWGIGQFATLADFFQAGRDLGFAHFELNHGVDSAMLAGLSLNGHISSVHEPCPADVPMDALKARDWLVSALDEEDRRRGVAAMRPSVDLARELGVSAIIVHPGRVIVDPALEKNVRALYGAGKAGTPEFVAAREQLLGARAAHAAAHMRSVRRSVLELAEYAAVRGVRLGLENRDRLTDIPLADELEELLNLGCGDTVGYWHDVGHAQVHQHLGLGSQEDWLQRFAGRTIGVHLHDVQGLEDHRPPGRGAVDWPLVARYLPDDLLRTCEIRPFHPAGQVRQALAFVQNTLAAPLAEAGAKPNSED